MTTPKDPRDLYILALEQAGHEMYVDGAGIHSRWKWDEVRAAKPPELLMPQRSADTSGAHAHRWASSMDGNEVCLDCGAAPMRGPRSEAQSVADDDISFTAYLLMKAALSGLVAAVEEGNYDGAAMANARAVLGASAVQKAVPAGRLSHCPRCGRHLPGLRPSTHRWCDNCGWPCNCEGHDADGREAHRPGCGEDRLSAPEKAYDVWCPWDRHEWNHQNQCRKCGFIRSADEKADALTDPDRHSNEVETQWRADEAVTAEAADATDDVLLANFIAQRLADKGYAIGVPDFTAVKTGHVTSGTLELAVIAAEAVREAGWCPATDGPSDDVIVKALRDWALVSHNEDPKVAGNERAILAVIRSAASNGFEKEAER